MYYFTIHLNLFDRSDRGSNQPDDMGQSSSRKCCGVSRMERTHLAELSRGEGATPVRGGLGDRNSEETSEESDLTFQPALGEADVVQVPELLVDHDPQDAHLRR